MLVCGGWIWEITPFNLVTPWCNLPPLHRYVSIDVITVFDTRNGFAWCLDHDFFQLKVTWTIPKDDLHLPSNTPETPPNARWFRRFRIESPQEMLEVILGELKPGQLSRADGQSFHLQKDGWQANLGSPERWDGGKSRYWSTGCEQDASEEIFGESQGNWMASSLDLHWIKVTVYIDPPFNFQTRKVPRWCKKHVCI